MAQPIIRTMTLGEKGFRVHPTYELGTGPEQRILPLEQEVVLKIVETFAIAAGDPGRIFLTSTNYVVQVDRYDENRVLMTFLKAPKDSWMPSPVVAVWLQMAFTRHLLGLKCACGKHCPKCGRLLGDPECRCHPV